MVSTKKIIGLLLPKHTNWGHFNRQICADVDDGPPPRFARRRYATGFGIRLIPSALRAFGTAAARQPLRIARPLA
jgi:hypothetical protein